LGDRHAAGLLDLCASEPDIWRYIGVPVPRDLPEMKRWIASAWERAGAAPDLRELPFAIVERAGGRAAGSTRYLDIRAEHRGLEIGWTWLGRAYRRTALNTECKYLLLRNAFEEMGAVRVQLKTDARNLVSRKAIERIGGVQEGVLRRHMLLSDGYVRDSVMYSITDVEWPDVRARLLRMLEHGG
jgi:RimJ/RimL family protein N-acetyltransferase